MSYPYLVMPAKAGVFIADVEKEEEVGVNRVYVGVHYDMDRAMDAHVDLFRVQDCSDGTGDVEISVYGTPGSLEPTYELRVHAKDIKAALGG